MDGEKRRGGLRTFVLGSVVGAGAAIAAVNRRRRLQRRRGRPRGLAAFESAPCYLELLEREREGAGLEREGSIGERESGGRRDH